MTIAKYIAALVAPLLLVTALLDIVAAAEKPAAVPVIGKIKWVYDYEEGKRLSSETGKPMFVVFRCER
ncbi:MAG: hypothetical protein ACI9G1_004063 [Pirellulaceae bacterium]|jgi:hypothetical protein